MTNCPNCGAPYDPALCKCPYCGTIYFDFVQVDLGGPDRAPKPFYVRFLVDGREVRGKFYLTNLSFEMSPELLDIRTLGDPFPYFVPPRAPDLYITLSPAAPPRIITRDI